MYLEVQCSSYLHTAGYPIVDCLKRYWLVHLSHNNSDYQQTVEDWLHCQKHKDNLIDILCMTSNIAPNMIVLSSCSDVDAIKIYLCISKLVKSIWTLKLIANNPSTHSTVLTACQVTFSCTACCRDRWSPTSPLMDTAVKGHSC